MGKRKMQPAHVLAGVGIFFAAASLTEAARMNNVDGQQGVLHIHGEMTDSPCRLRMDSRDQAINLGSVAAARLKLPGARSTPVRFTLRLEDCLMASGYIRDEQSVGALLGRGRPTVSVSFMALANPDVPSLIRLEGVKGIGLRITDNLNRHADLNSPGTLLPLTPGDNVLSWNVAVERTPESLVSGPFPGDYRFQSEL